jgi:hypothetical protein
MDGFCDRGKVRGLEIVAKDKEFLERWEAV